MPYLRVHSHMDKTGDTANRHSSEKDALFAKQQSSRTHSVLIRLQDQGARWESLRDKIITSPELASNLVASGDEETWNADEVFMKFLLDRLEQDLEAGKEVSFHFDPRSFDPQLETKRQKSEHSRDHSVKRKLTSASGQPNRRLRASLRRNPRSAVCQPQGFTLMKTRSNKPAGVGSRGRGGRNSTPRGQTWNEEANDEIPALEALHWENSTGEDMQNEIHEVSGHRVDKVIKKEFGDGMLVHQGQPSSKTSQACQDIFRISHAQDEIQRGSVNKTVSQGQSSDGLDTGILVEMPNSVSKSSQESEEDRSIEKESTRDDNMKTRGNRRSRVELDGEKEAEILNKRLKEIEHHNLPRMFSCRSCGEQFQESEDLRMHTITAHLPINIPDNGKNVIENGEIMFTHIEIDLGLYEQVNKADIGELAIELKCCPECNEYVENVKTHAETHMVKNYICEACGKGFASCRQLRMHGVYHKTDGDNLRPYSCNFCDKTFRTAQSLSIHRPLHNKARNYVCQQCGKTFKANTRLQKHIGTHAEHKRYPCSICGREFAQKCNMTRHFRTHTGEKPYDCRECGQAFNHNISLKRHMKKEHLIELEDRTSKTVEEIDDFPSGRLPSRKIRTEKVP